MKKLFKIFASVKIAVVCLFLLFVLTFWGTVAQVHQGLYAAQERFFNSFFFLAAGFIPFPGAQLILWVLGVNLIFSGISHFSKLRHWRFAGLKLIHVGLLLYFVASYVTFHVTEESNLNLAEGQGSNVSSSYHAWEIAFWNENAGTHQVTAIDIRKDAKGPIFNGDGFIIEQASFYPNCVAFRKTLPSSGERLINASGITLLQLRNTLKEHEKNMAGGIFKITHHNKVYDLLLFGGETQPTPIMINGQAMYFQLRHKRYPLPLMLTLDDFKVEFYPGSQTPKSYESYVTLVEGGTKRQAKIYMNAPLLYKDYAFYQASYQIDAQGREYSTLAVVKNKGRVLPYIACFAVFFGLVAHFLIMVFEKRLKR